MGDEPYYTVKDVTRLTGYSLRQVDRYIEKGVFIVLNPNQKHHPRKVSQASVHAFNEANGHRPVDAVDLLKQEHVEQKQATGDVLIQLATLRARVDELERLVEGTVADLEFRLRVQMLHRSRETAPTRPEGAILLVRFAEVHHVTMGKLRGLVERDPTLATVIERPDAQQKKHKWMILPAQMAPMLAVLEKQGVPYTPCTSCPHDSEIRAITGLTSTG